VNLSFVLVYTNGHFFKTAREAIMSKN